MSFSSPGSGDHHEKRSGWMPLPMDAELRAQAAEQRAIYDERRQAHRDALQSGVKNRVAETLETRTER